MQSAAFLKLTWGLPRIYEIGAIFFLNNKDIFFLVSSHNYNNFLYN